MDELWNWLRAHGRDEIAAVSGAPVLFAVAVFIAGVLLFTVIRAFFRERIEAQAATITHKESLLSEYKDRLNGATPMEVATEIASLKAEVGRLSGKVDRPQRRITDEQRAKIVAAISGEPLLQRCWIRISSTPDTEAGRFCTQIIKALREGGMNVENTGPGKHDEGEHGVIFYGPTGALNPNYEALLTALRDAGVDVKREQDADSPTQVYIFVAPEAD